jgi:3'-5' exoribonuclease
MLNLNPNDTLEGQPLIVRQISKKVGQNNKEYYHLQLSHGIQNFDAKIWNGNQEIAQEITPGCIANVWGSVKDFKGNIQIHVSRIEKIQNPDKETIDSLTPAIEYNPEKLAQDIYAIIDTVKAPELNQLLMDIFSSSNIKNSFYKKAAGAEIHHAYMGGLAEHTIEVARTVMHFCTQFPSINYDVAVTAALLHDIGKTAELSNFPENKYTTRGRLLGHIFLGIEILKSAASNVEGLSGSTRIELEHCILSHHGTLETGSPVLPMTLEAIALHNADKASAEINGFYLAIQRDNSTNPWTDFNNTYKRYIKKL